MRVRRVRRVEAPPWSTRAGHGILLHFDRQRAAPAEQTCREQVPQPRLVADDGCQLAADSCRAGPAHRRGRRPWRQLSHFLGRGPPGHVCRPESMSRLPRQHQRTAQQPIRDALSTLQVRSGLARAAYTGLRQRPIGIVLPTMSIAVECDRVSNYQQVHWITARSWAAVPRTWSVARASILAPSIGPGPCVGFAGATRAFNAQSAVQTPA